MTEDRRTKAQLVEELVKAQAEAEALRGKVPQPRQIVPEANALDKCVQTLEPLNKATSGQSYGYQSTPKQPSVAFVLNALYDRFGVPRPEVVVPCNRQHVDDLTAADIAASIQRGGLFR